MLRTYVNYSKWSVISFVSKPPPPQSSKYRFNFYYVTGGIFIEYIMHNSFAITIIYDIRNPKLYTTFKPTLLKAQEEYM